MNRSLFCLEFIAGGAALLILSFPGVAQVANDPATSSESPTLAAWNFLEFVKITGQNSNFVSIEKGGVEWKPSVLSEKFPNCVAMRFPSPQSFEAVSVVKVTAVCPNDMAGSISVVLAGTPHDLSVHSHVGYGTTIKLDWVGEETVEIPISDFRPFGDPTGFGEIRGITLGSSGFGAKIEVDDLVLTVSRVEVE